MPIVRKIDPPPPGRAARATGQTFDERYPVFEPPPLAVLDAAIAASQPSRGDITPGAVVSLPSGELAVALNRSAEGLQVYLPGAGVRLVPADTARPHGRIPRISRVTTQTHGDSWLARYYRESRETSRHFAVRRYGGLVGALCAAVAATHREWPTDAE